MSIYLFIALMFVLYYFVFISGVRYGRKDSEPLRDIQKYLCVSCRRTVNKWLGEETK